MTAIRMIASMLTLGLLAGALSLARADEWSASTELRQTRLSTWRASISAPIEPDANTGNSKLAEASRKLHELILPGAVAAVKSAPAQAPPIATTQPASKASTQPVAAPTTQPAARPAISPEDVERLGKMELERLSDAVGTADSLFLGKQYEAALAIYVRLKDHAPDAKANATGRDWLIFQAANCSVRLGRHGEAAKLYGELVTKFPSSAWVSVAKVQASLANWQVREDAAKLLGLSDDKTKNAAGQTSMQPQMAKTTESK